MIRRTASLGVAFLAAIVLVGWASGVPELTGAILALTPMNPATAVAFLLAAASLWLFEPGRDGSPRCLAARGLALAVASIGLVRLAAYALGVEAGVDRVLFADRLALGSDLPNRMAPNTALNFLLLGTALAVPDGATKQGRRLAEGITIAALILTLIVLVGYSYSERALLGFESFTPMALLTALGFVGLGIGILAARDFSGFAAVLRSSSGAGVRLHRLLFAVLVIPWFIGWLRIRGERAGLYETELGVTLFTVATMLMLGGVTWWTARSVVRIERRRREVERKLRESERRARAVAERVAAANAELESFSYSVSHDLRAPLRAIEGYGRILVDDHAEALDEEGHRVLGVIRDNARQMGRLIDDLLAFSRVGRKEIEGAPIDMGELARMVAREVEARGGSPRVRFAVGALPPAWGDRGMLRQALLNLVDNACKFSREARDPLVEIEGAGADGMVTYAVRDNGVGFEMEYAEKIFGVFQRLHRAEEYEGTGVGLAIVERIVVRHGGRVWAEGAPGRGAVFRFTLPVGAEGRRSDVEPSGGDPPGRGQPG